MIKRRGNEGAALAVPATRTARLVGLGSILAALFLLWPSVWGPAPRPATASDATDAAVNPAPPTPEATLAGDRGDSSGHIPSPATPVSNTLSFTTFLPLAMTYYPTLPPDLLVTNVSFDAPDLVATQPFPFSVTVYNQGDGDTGQGRTPAWFTVEVYVKHSSFVPAGPPTDALDHAGGFCSNGSPNCATGTQQPAHVLFVSGLPPGTPHTARFTLTLPDPGLYDLYVQVDTTWDASGYTGQAWGQHLEKDETNNVFAVEDVYAPTGR